MELQRTRVDGSVLIYEVRLAVNLAALWCVQPHKYDHLMKSYKGDGAAKAELDFYINHFDDVAEAYYQPSSYDKAPAFKKQKRGFIEKMVNQHMAAMASDNDKY